MKAKTLLLAGLASGCTMDSGINPNSPTYQEELCIDKLENNTIDADKFLPSSFPLDVSTVTADAVFKEVLNGFREDIFAVATVENTDETYSFYKVEILSAIEDFDFADRPLEFENGDYQTSVDFGGVPAFQGSHMELLITNDSCDSVYGFAGYNVSSNDSYLEFYMDQNGDFVYL